MKPDRSPRLGQGSLTRRDTLWLLSTTTAALLTPSVLTGCSVNPVTGEKQLLLMSREQEIAVDQSQAPHQFSADFGVLPDSALNAYITSVGDALTMRSHRPDMPYSFRAVQSPNVNAYAFPGGSVAVTRGILLAMNNEAQLAGLLGHEIGHINARHAAQRQTKGLLAQAVLSGTSILAQSKDPLLGQLTQTLGGVASGALLAHYSRENEREADNLGMDYMSRVGQNPQGMVELMQILVDTSKHSPSALELMFATHPMSSERLATARSQAERLHAKDKDVPLRSERYMDHTVAIRKQKETITLLQQAQQSMAQKQYDQTESALNSALGHTPDDYTALVLMAKTQLALEKNKEALRYAEAALKVQPREGQALQVAGVAHIAERHYEAALDRFATLDRVLPGNPNTDFLQGIACEGMGNRSEAARFFMAYLKAETKGEQAKYAYQRLVSWGVVKPKA
ncbi:MAG: M48 family metalloprotease [Magnetococcales bacterium]|nr:M48 family metalloprotease [Magnetococcales bacterium]MBF0151598.1 M48 family metalloprotease [Magnetococcales bacterium]MBF0171813.1 M48 family metalloprotease [Magnetococcales bacterium]MBF0348721.1 M48 family metalloprotease [Magnetococcales bacterium]